MNILLTGGAGYIGSHAAVVLTEAGHEVVLLDNLCNSQAIVLERLKVILGKGLTFVEGDIRNYALVTKILHDHKINAVIHFAGLKSVSDSMISPVQYYANNVQGTISLLGAMQSAGVKTLVFSSSATVYGNPECLPIDENHPTSPINAYGRGKLHVEEMLRDVASSDLQWKIISLRYFNPVGAHESGLIGESPKGSPNNLMPYLTKVASGELPYLSVYGDDYDTADGTGERDYIHIVDLAFGHLAALNFINKKMGFHVFNLGTGKASSVFEVIKEFEKACGKLIPIQIKGRRPGDSAVCYAQIEKAAADLDWRATRTIGDMCSSAWNFQKRS